MYTIERHNNIRRHHIQLPHSYNTNNYTTNKLLLIIVQILQQLLPVLTISINIKNTMMTSKSLRSVHKVLEKPSPHWVGDGFKVYPVFANLAFKEAISPLLMFDYGEPTQFAPRPNANKPLGVGEHPHRGFETVTVAFHGEVEHKDSTGQTGIIKEGDVQWMTAGRGIIHQEHHSYDFTKTGGTFEMCQLWVNLPKKYKMTKPGYQDIKKKDIAVVNLPLGTTDEKDVVGTARIIAGELDNTKGPAKTFSPVQMWDVTINKANTVIDLPYKVDHNCIVFVRRGSIEILSGKEEQDANNNDTCNATSMKSVTLNPQDVALMKLDGNDSDYVRIKSLEKNSSIMILGGEPIKEPIAARGPFVMNTQEELRQAMIDYQTGKMGR